MDAPTLVVLAAGMGSRFGSAKQILGVGAQGETLMDYSVFDALSTGFGHVVFIVRRSMADDFREAVCSRLDGAVNYEIVYQELDSFLDRESMSKARAAGRSKPWGTAHAVICAREAIRSPFAVINADDYYGRGAFAAMAAFLSGPAAYGIEAEGAISAFPLRMTLSSAGPVARGVCGIREGYLQSVVERMSIERRDGRIVSDDSGTEEVLAGDTAVSMNFWGFPLNALDGIEAFFGRFLAENAGEPKAECFLPAAVDDMIASGILRVRALTVDSQWFGMTYREDRKIAAGRIAELVAAGAYPSPLWTGRMPSGTSGPP